jgi:hypothetical protein
MGSLIGMLVGKQVFGRVIGPKAARFLVYAGLAILVVVALGMAKCTYDRSIIQRHELKIEAEVAKADRKADNKAAEQRRVDDSRLVVEANELKKVQANAQDDIARRLAKHRCLRMQQAARRENKPPPSC